MEGRLLNNGERGALLIALNSSSVIIVIAAGFLVLKQAQGALRTGETQGRLEGD